MTEDVRVTRRVTIPAAELSFRFTPAGGPGGQHANRSSTRVEVTWNVEGSRALGPRQRARLLRKLQSRLDGEGNLRVAAGERRSQAQNRKEAVARLAETVERALRVPRARRATAPSAAARRRRLERKRRRGETKRLRRPPAPE